MSDQSPEKKYRFAVAAFFILGTFAGFGIRYVQEPPKPPGDVRVVLNRCNEVAHRCWAGIDADHVTLFVNVTRFGESVTGGGETIEEAAVSFAKKAARMGVDLDAVAKKMTKP